MIVLFLSIALASPTGPQPADEPQHTLSAPSAPDADVVATWTAVEYLDHFEAQYRDSVHAAEAAANSFRQNRSRAAMDTLLTQLRAISLAARDRAQSLPAWHDDPSVRDAVAANYQVVVDVMADQLPKIYALYSKETVVEADLAEAESLHVAWTTRIAEADGKTQLSVAAFAARNHIQLIPAPEAGYSEEHFPAPELVPPGGHLDPEDYAGFAGRYRNGMVRHYDELIRTINTLFDASGRGAADLAAARAASSTAVRATLAAQDAEGAWLGDRSLLDANRGLAEALLTAIDGDFAAYEAILGNPRRTKDEAAEGNAIAARLNATLQAAQAGALGAYRPFEQHWRLAELRDWWAVKDAAEAPRAEPSPP